MQMIEPDRRKAAVRALGILRSCGLRPLSDGKAVHRMLEAYAQSYGKREVAPVTAVRELLAEYSQQRPALDLFGWLTEISRA